MQDGISWLLEFRESDPDRYVFRSNGALTRFLFLGRQLIFSEDLECSTIVSHHGSSEYDISGIRSAIGERFCWQVVKFDP